MEENKEALKQDLELVIKLNGQLDYSNISSVKELCASIGEQKLLNTSAGQKYIKKLKQILEGSDDNSCIFCGKPSRENSVICEACLAKELPNRNLNTVKADDISKTNHTVQADEMIRKVGVAASAVFNQENLEKAKTVAKKATSKVDERFKEFDEKTDMKNKASGIFGRLKRFWGKRSKKQRIVIIGILVFLIIGVFAGGGGSDNYLDVLGMAKEEVDAEYGTPVGIELISGMNFYRYSNGLCTEYKSVPSGQIADCVGIFGSTGQLLGVKYGDSVRSAEKSLEKNLGEKLEKIGDGEDNGIYCMTYMTSLYIIQIDLTDDGKVSGVFVTTWEINE